MIDISDEMTAPGDRLLASAAARLRLRMRPGDIVGRLGGDEFLVVLPNLADVDTARERVNELIEGLAVPLDVIAGISMCIRASTGIAWPAE